ncbi:MAG: type II toxin-antitoxin system VapC family toxin [Lautropia sp.]|nr:type II toxin-antitoxin system VapC family toxin [Lautropia sp.]
MKFLFDTHVLLWLADDRLPLESPVRRIVTTEANQRYFSAASIWEIAIKASLGRPDFSVDASLFRRGLLDNGYTELAVRGDHAVATRELPLIHKDPFDRLLVAQSRLEGMTLVSADVQVLRYGGSVLGA